MLAVLLISVRKVVCELKQVWA